jgi:hypothetical protein
MIDYRYTDNWEFYGDQTNIYNDPKKLYRDLVMDSLNLNEEKGFQKRLK